MRKLVLFFVSVVVLGVGAVGFLVQSYLNSTPGGTEEEIVFSVEAGSFIKTAKNLEAEGIITDSKKFVLLAKLTGNTSKIRVGEFSLHKNMTPQEVLQELVAGKLYQYKFTVQEGLNLYEIAEVLEQKGLIKSQKEFVRLCKNKKFISELVGKDIPSLEGYLFPETYQIPKGFSEESIIRMMVGKFFSVFEEIRSMEDVLKLSERDHIILASMIEKETGAPFERTVISSVFHNRLRKKMRLQSDPTILYGIKEETGVWKKNITRKDIKAYTKYNTYRVSALPYGPISNPGRDSLLAAVKPKNTSYLYFVSQNDGTHYFSKTFKEHNQAVRKYQLNHKARQGKSWRDLSKKLGTSSN